jgi:hypothetical protein
MYPSSLPASNLIRPWSMLAPAMNELPCPNSFASLVNCSEPPNTRESVEVRSTVPYGVPATNGIGAPEELRIWKLPGGWPENPSSSRHRVPSSGGSHSSISASLPSTCFWRKRRI